MGKYMKRQKKKRLILRIFRNLICIGLFVILAALLGNAWVIGSTKGLIKKESEVFKSRLYPCTWSRRTQGQFTVAYVTGPSGDGMQTL